mgnify:CR=1 FL=1
MKILKFLAGLILFLVIAFFAIGFIKPAVNYGHEVQVDKPVEEAWAVMLDDSKYGQWLEGFKSIELIRGEKGAKDSQYKVIVNPGKGQPDFEMIETVTDFKENEFVDLHFDSDMMVFDQKTIFTKNGSKTKVRTESTVKGKGAMMKSMFALMEIFGGSFQAQEAKNVEALKKVIEENTTDYYPVPTMEVVEEM